MDSNTVLEILLFTGIGVLLVIAVSLLVYIWMRFKREEAAFEAAQIEAYAGRPPSIMDDPLPKYVAPTPTPHRQLNLNARVESPSVFHWLGVRAPSYHTHTRNNSRNNSRNETPASVSQLSMHQAHLDYSHSRVSDEVLDRSFVSIPSPVPRHDRSNAASALPTADNEISIAVYAVDPPSAIPRPPAHTH